jgi:hypothetical protein
LYKSLFLLPSRTYGGKEKSGNLDTNALEVVRYTGSTQEEFKEGSESAANLL